MKGGGGGVLYIAILVHHFAINFLCQFGDIIGLIVAIFVCVIPPNSSAAKESMPCTHDNRLSRGFVSCEYYECATIIVVDGTMKRGAFGFERGRSAAVYRFGENPAKGIALQGTR